MSLSSNEIIRYSRQISLPEIGGAGQRKLRQARALIVGAGALGSPAALYLAAAGTGTIGIADDEQVELSNLGRQVIHTTAAIGSHKVDSAAAAVRALNPEVQVETHRLRLDETNASEIIERYDVVIDGTDDYPSRYLINDCAVRAGKPLCHGSVLGFEGQAATILPGRGPCYRCIYPEPPEGRAMPSCQEAGVLGTVPSVIGSIQATEAIKIILGIGELLSGRLLVYDALAMEVRIVKTARVAGCEGCGEMQNAKCKMQNAK